MKITATIDLLEAADAPWDAIVIGAGPAGAFAAIGLARAGLSTLLVDRQAFPRRKVCGGCLNARAIAALKSAGLLSVVLESGAQPLSAAHLRYRNRVVALPLPDGLAISRATLDALLVRTAIAAGCSFLPEASAKVRPDDGVAIEGSSRRRGVTLLQRDGGTCIAMARTVIVADGLPHHSLDDCPEFKSVIARDARIGVGGPAPNGVVDCAPGTITMAVGRGGYVGVTAVENGQLNIAAALDADFLKAHGRPAAAVSEILTSAEVATNATLNDVDFQGTVPLTRRLTRPVGARVFVLGDAAGYIEPFTGEGMAWALSAARALVPFVIRGTSDWDGTLERDWLAMYARLVGREQVVCRAIARLLRQSWLLGPLGAALARQPALVRPIVAHLARPVLSVGDP